MVQVKEIQRSHNKKQDPQKVKEQLEVLRKEHSKLVKGKFEFIDAQGGWLEFNYRFFPEDLLVTYKFVHGEICEIPMGLVKHLNGTQKKIRRLANNNNADISNTRGVPSTCELVSRVRFTPIEYI